MSEQQSEQQLRAELDAVYRSASWKVTSPLRLLNAALRSILPSTSTALHSDETPLSQTVQNDVSITTSPIASDVETVPPTIPLDETPKLPEIVLSPSASAIFVELNTLIDKQNYAHRT
jgi:hypothetical protein